MQGFEMNSSGSNLPDFDFLELGVILKYLL